MKILRKYVYLIPILQIAATFILSFIDITEYGFVKIGNAIGYSILTSMVYMAYFLKKSNKFCFFTKASVIGLFLMSALNLMGSYVSYDDYCRLFDRTIFSIVCLLTILYSNSNVVSRG